jgi:hypothetical protein
MEPVLPPVLEYGAPPLRGTIPLRPPQPPPPLQHHRWGTPLVIIGSGLLGAALIAMVAIRLLQAGATVQTPTHITQQIALTGVRPVAAAPPAAGVAAETQVSFPAKTSVVDIEVNSGAAAGQAPVQVAVALGDPAETIIQNAYVLNPTGDTVIPLTPPGAAFAPGDYTVTISYRGALLGSTAFAVH